MKLQYRSTRFGFATSMVRLSGGIGTHKSAVRGSSRARDGSIGRASARVLRLLTSSSTSSRCGPRGRIAMLTRKISAGLGLYVLLAGAVSFAGWVFDDPRLTDWAG